MAEKKITITATMEERWVDHFCTSNYTFKNTLRCKER